MSLTIPEPPDTLACSACSMPLDWVWRHRDERWYAICRFAAHPDPAVVRLHTCPLPGVKRHPYRLDSQPTEVYERGRQLARATLAAVAAKGKSGTEKPERRGR